MKNSASTRCALWIPCIPCWWYYLVVLLVQIGIWWSHSMNWSVFPVEKGVHVHLLFKMFKIQMQHEFIEFSKFQGQVYKESQPYQVETSTDFLLASPTSYPGGWGTGCGHCKTHGFYREKHGCIVQPNRLLYCCALNYREVIGIN